MVIFFSFPPASLSQEREAQDNAEPHSSGPSENEVALQEALNTLQQEKDTLSTQYQAQVYTSVKNAIAVQFFFYTINYNSFL